MHLLQMSCFSPPYFLVLDANQATVMIGLFEIIGLVYTQLRRLTVLGIFEIFAPQLDPSLASSIRDITGDLWVASTISTLMTVVSAVAPILLVVGVMKRKRCLMLLWMVLCWLGVIIGPIVIAAVIYATMAKSLFPFSAHPLYPVPLIIVLTYVETVYGLMVVSRSYKDMAITSSYETSTKMATLPEFIKPCKSPPSLYGS